MIRYVIKRILIVIPLLLLMALLTFVFMQKTAGSFYDSLRMDPLISQETIDYYEDLYQLDRPLSVQFFHWFINLFRLEFGYSFHYNIPVFHVLKGRLWNTFILSLASMLLTWGVALPLGIWAALRRNRFVDRVIQFLAYISLSTPSFLLAILLMYAASRTGWLPMGGMHSAHYEEFSVIGRWWDLLKHMAIPAVCLSVASIGFLQRIMRGNMLEALRQQYVLTARAKGLPENRVIYIHALRNAVNPLITILGYSFSSLLSGAAILEIVYGWPGLGTLMLTAVRSKDIYLVMTSFMMSGILLLIGILMSDILLAKCDPRIRYE